jgi:hypothetical protein
MSSNYYTEYAPLFERSEQREWAQLYLRGQLSDLERERINPIIAVMPLRKRLSIRSYLVPHSSVNAMIVQSDDLIDGEIPNSI